MGLNLKTTTIDGVLSDVLSEDEYTSKWKLYYENPSMRASTAVEVQDVNGDSYVLPFRGKTDDRPGIYPDGSLYFVKFPNEEAKENYLSKNLNIVDFNDVRNVEDFLDKNSQIRDMETNVLTDIDSVFVPPADPNDSPEMRAFKDAIKLKRIDINKYAPRFGDNFLNDKRILRTNSITVKKLVSMCQKLDIEAELTLRDTSGDIANPMGKEITIVLTGSGGDDDDE